jgi:hypothetical protein
MRKLLLLLMLLPCLSHAQIRVSNQIENQNNQFVIVSKAATATIYYDTSENVLVKKSAEFLAGDIEKVTGRKPQVVVSKDALESNMIIVATIGNNPLIDQLIKEKKLNVDAIRGQWERFIMQTIKNPFHGVKQALVIVGSDRRGAAYGVFTLSEEMGVSPWYWWADVPVKKSTELYIEEVRYVSNSPAVKYRGIFINDEAPALRNWAKEKFGDLNHAFYEKVFELLLRNKTNYLWPAMWLPTVFNEDDPLNPKVADEFGIVVSTSHHEPMMRSHNEWNQFNGGAWNYQTNKEKLLEFWRGGIKRMKNYESVVTVGMRGDGDESMAQGTAVDLLKTIIADQREILANVTGKPAKETPQVWAIYKEVQDYYDKGMRVDDDIIVLFCDDNWGNLRILPKKKDLTHKGGYGIYYHFEYVGAPVSYRWQNVTQIERVWEQMNSAYKSGVKDIWLVNVGDIKPMELPTSFFLDFAWNPDAIKANDLPGYYVNWAKKQFGNQYAGEIAEILSLYTKYNARRTQEMLKPDTYSLENYREADRIVDEFKQLLEKSKNIYEKLPENQRSAFYQLVLSPVEMNSNLNEMYVAAGKNKLYGEQGRASANYYAEKVKELFFKDAELTNQFHKKLENGKWNHMMSQTHIGYTSWNHPRANMMPGISYVQTDSAALLGYTIEHGLSPAWGGFSVEGNGLFSPGFIAFDPINQQSCYVEIFNRGGGILNYSIKAKNDWIQLSKKEGSIQYDEKVYVSIDWNKAPKGNVTGEIEISGAGNQYKVNVPIRNNIPEAFGFVENNGVVSFEASHFSNKIDSKDIHWTEVPNLGRTHSSMIIEPADADRLTLSKISPRLEYTFTVFDSGELKVRTYLSPTQDFRKNDGLKYAIAIDDDEPQIVNMNEGEIKPDYEYAEWWMQSVADHIKIKKSTHKVEKPGKHTLKIWAIDPGVVFQKFVIDAGGLKASYLGPPESVYLKQ